jgi:hypothetical protein
MKTVNTQSPPPPNTNEYQMPAELDATPHPLVEAEQRAGQMVARVMSGVSSMLHEHMLGVKLELRAVTNDNSVLRQNLALLNEGVADFQREQVIPLRSELANLREEQGGRVIENARKLELLIKSLTEVITLAGAHIPEDLKQQIKDGHFEDLDHKIADETGSAEAQGYVPGHMVQAMIDAAVRKALTDNGVKIHEATANDGDRPQPDA